jgi:hypothetical protein
MRTTRRVDVPLIFFAFELVSCARVEPLLVDPSGSDDGGQDQAAAVAPSSATPSGGGAPPVLLLQDGGASAPCSGSGLPCAVQQGCEGGAKTTVTAKVYDPAGKVPLYDVVVYVPSTSVDDISTGPTCDTCATPVSGHPIASALTDATGQFVLQDVPVGSNVPLVIQIGKWRRLITLPEIKACQNNQFDDPATFRLPANQSEGHLPKIALAVGGADSLECLLRRMGVSDSEFTDPSGTGRINLYTNDLTGGASVNNAVTAYAKAGTFPAFSQLFASFDAADGGLADGGVGALSNYDVVVVSCQGSQAAGRAVTAPEKVGLKAFLDTGGRVFLEHYNYSWLRGGLLDGDKVIQASPEGAAIDKQTKYTQSPFPAIAEWEDPVAMSYAPGGDGSYLVDTSFPKGSAMADWLFSVGASTVRASIDLVNVKDPATSVMATVAQRWVYDDKKGVPYLSANTPLEEAAAPNQQCGRVVHTGIHVSTVANDTIAPFPTGCASSDLTPQEKAMEFLLFDLSSCVSNDMLPPAPPTPLPQ